MFITYIYIRTFLGDHQLDLELENGFEVRVSACAVCVFVCVSLSVRVVGVCVYSGDKRFKW